MTLEKWAHIAEITSGIAIVVTIIVLIAEVRANSGLLQRQIELERIDRATIFDSPFLPEVLEQIKAVDGVSPPVQRFMDRYDLTFVDAARWVRYMRQQWGAHEADFLLGETQHLDESIPNLLRFPDQVLYYESARSGMDPAFVEYIEQFERVDVSDPVR